MLHVHDEVREAIGSGRPVVALESTLIAHGLPGDLKRGAADRINDAVRGEGAVPATIAVVDGVAVVGTDRVVLDRLIAPGVKKASLRDLPVAISQGGVWATTVAATMAIASRAQIPVFATGGIGGVHRKVTETYDESADLLALARYPVLVVSAGPKAVLDLRRTMERLETLGVPVIGYQTEELPAFYHARSGIRLDHSAHSVDELAKMLRSRLAFGGGGMLVAQAPPPSLAREPQEVEALINRALAEAEAMGVQGNEVTPFLLSALAVASDGRLVETNIALVEENARLAAQIAAAYATSAPGS